VFFRRRARTGQRLALASLIASAAAIGARGQPPTAPAQGGAPQAEQTAAPASWPTLEGLRSARDAAQSAPDLDQATRDSIVSTYAQAIAMLEAAEAATTQAAAFDADREAAPGRLAEVRAAIDALGSSSAQADLTGALEALDARLTERRAELERWRSERESLAAEAARRASRLAELPALIAKAREEAAAAGDGAVAAPAEVLTIAAAERALAEARRRRAQSELRLLTAEQASYAARADLLTARRERADRMVAVLTREVEALQQEVARRRAAAADAQAEQSREQATDLPPALASAATANAALAEELASIQRRLAEAQQDAAAARERASAQAPRLEEIRARASAGEGPWVGVQLRTELQRLPDPTELAREHRRLARAINAARRRQIEIESEIVALGASPEDAADALVSSVDDPGRWRARAESLLRDRLETLRSLSSATNDLLGALSEHATAVTTLANDARRLRRFIEERILWVRSSDAVTGEAPARLVRELRAELAPAIWARAPAAAREEWLARPVRHTAAAIAALALIALARRSRWIESRIRGRGAKPGRHDAKTALAGVGLAGVRAAAWAGPLAVGSEFFGSIGPGWGPGKPLAAALWASAWFTFVARLVWLLCREGGVGERDFRWPADARRAVRATLRWWAVPAGAALAATAFAETSEAAPGSTELLRVFLVVSQILLIALVWRVGRRRSPVMRAFWGPDRSGWLYRVWPALHVGLLTAGASLVAAALAGYVYTAARLTERVWLSAGALVGVVTLRALVRRWAVLQRRALAVEQLRAEQARQGAAPGDAAPPIEPDAIDAGAVGAQTLRLVRAVVVVTAVAALAAIWSGVAPALGALDRVRAPGLGVSVVELGAAALAVVVTVILARNLPGLLEALVIRRLPIDAGARYAITTLVRYALLVAGILAASGAVGLRWSQVQWLAAAATVGLGFGLQEIFANFVSGLIILFERPVRLGDTVTVGNLTGTVTRIRMRATTILDWDRKEIIIPNKEFITTQLVNWTLTDSVLRIICPVGIAYGSDTALAERLLYEVAAEVPRVLDDPPPKVIFQGFGDSTLNFELRAYIDSIEWFVSIRHEINNLIDRKFREHGIEIAFPQRDLHVRSIPRPVAEALARSAGRGGGVSP